MKLNFIKNFKPKTKGKKMISLEENIKMADLIKRALSFWNFTLAEQKLKKLNDEQKGVREYFDFLFETGQFEKLDFLKAQNLSDTKWGGVLS